MSRNLAALGAVVVVGALLWLVMAWHAPASEDPAALDPTDVPSVTPPPSAAPAPEPSLAAPALPSDPNPVPAPASVPESPPHQQQMAIGPDGKRTIPEQIQGDQGPVAEYRSLYESETRGSDAASLEATLQKAFTDAPVEADFIKSVSCHETICKIEMRWSMGRMRPYVAGLTRVSKSFIPQVALSPVTAADDKGLRVVEV